MTLTVQEGQEAEPVTDSGPENDVLWRFTEVDNEGAFRPFGPLANHLAQAEGVIYFGSASTGCLHAIDAGTGESLWVHRGGDKIQTAPAVADGIVYASPTRKSYADATQVHALDSKTGEVLWEFESSGSGATSPVVSGGRVLFGSNDNRMLGHRAIALDSRTGDFLWAHSTGERIYGVATSPGKVYVTTRAGDLSVLDESTGKLVWQRQLQTPRDPYPTIYGETLLVASGRNNFLALNKDTGEFLWERDLEGGPTSQPLAENGVIFLGTAPWYLNALDIATGEIHWRMPYERHVMAAPALAGGRLILGTREGEILTIEAETGRLLKARPAGAPVHTRPIIVENAIVFSNQRDVVLAIPLPASPDDEETAPGVDPPQTPDNLLWTTYTGTRLFARPRTEGDKLFLVTPADEVISSGRIVALDKTDGGILWSAEDRGKWLMSWFPIGEEAVFLPSSRERMAARDSETGELLWEYSAGSAVPSFPLLGDSTLFFKSEDNILHAIDRFNGELRWKFDTRTNSRVWPNESDGLAYFGAIGIFALDEYTGEERWKVSVRGGLEGFPFLSGDYLCFQTDKNSVAALDRWTGEKAWEQVLDGQSLSLTVSDGVAYAATWGKKVYAIEVESGTLLWSAELDTLFSSGPQVTAAGGVVIAGTNSNGYTVFDAASGQELWKNGVQKDRSSPPWPSVSGGVAFIGDKFNGLIARDLRTGEMVRKYVTGDIGGFSAVISEGVAYLHASDGYTYAIDVSDAFSQ